MVPIPLIVAGMTTVLLLTAGLTGYQMGSKSVHAEWDAERVAAAHAIETQRTEALAKERTLQANVNRLHKEMTHEKTRLAAVQRELADSLHNRAERPSGTDVPTAARDRDAAPGCTGAELFRQDSEFLRGEAARADTLRLHLAACQAAYGEALKGQK